VKAVQDSDIIILAVDPSAVALTLKEDGIVQALSGKLLISVAAGWHRQTLEKIVTRWNWSNLGPAHPPQRLRTGIAITHRHRRPS
jgi:pyrroline-5-carboxylate reductase